MSQRLNRYFTNSPELRQLAHSARDLSELQQQYRRVVPPSLLRASHVRQFDRQTLTLAADNAAIAAKLRQLAPQLVQQLRQMGVEVTGIQVRVQVGTQVSRPATGRRALGAAGREQMANLADSLPDSPLKNALRRFSTL
jgi:hypothetical protein